MTTAEEACEGFKNGLALALAANRIDAEAPTAAPCSMGGVADIIGVTGGTLAGYLSGRRGEPEDWGRQSRAEPRRLTLSRVVSAVATGAPDGTHKELAGALLGGSPAEIIQALSDARNESGRVAAAIYWATRPAPPVVMADAAIGETTPVAVAAEHPRFSLPAYPEWEGDRDHPRYAECDDECRFCGRPIRQAKSFQVHEVDGGGYLAPVGEDYTDGNSDLGWWSIGSGCAKGIPAAFKERRRRGQPGLYEGRRRR